MMLVMAAGAELGGGAADEEGRVLVGAAARGTPAAFALAVISSSWRIASREDCSLRRWRSFLTSANMRWRSFSSRSSMWSKTFFEPSAKMADNDLLLSLMEVRMDSLPSVMVVVSEALPSVMVVWSEVLPSVMVVWSEALPVRSDSALASTDACSVLSFSSSFFSELWGPSGRSGRRCWAMAPRRCATMASGRRHAKMGATERAIQRAASLGSRGEGGAGGRRRWSPR